MPNTLLKHPTSGTYVFGYIAHTKSRGILIPGGPIHLKAGKHKGPNNGFGAAHIWAEHEKAMKVRGHASANLVPAYVAEIVCPGAGVYCEFAEIRSWHRLTVVKTTIGMAVLQYWSGEPPHYSIVTAYERKNANGTKIGSVLANL